MANDDINVEQESISAIILTLRTKYEELFKKFATIKEKNDEMLSFWNGIDGSDFYNKVNTFNKNFATIANKIEEKINYLEQTVIPKYNELEAELLASAQGLSATSEE